MNDISPIKIALVGRPLAGKTTILQCFARRTHNSHFTTEFDETKRIAQLDIALHGLSLHFVTISGAFVPSEDIIPKILTGASVIVFVISVSGAKEEQQHFFKQYVSHASCVDAHWNDIPWIFVLNKVDLGKRNPLLADIPAQFHNDIVHCVAREDKGIEQLWQQIIKTVSGLT
jgi:predicted GTPase